MYDDEPMDNTTLFERRQYCADSPDIGLIGRPHADVFHIDELIPPGIDISVKVMPNDKCSIKSSNEDNLRPKVVIDDMNLIICTKQLSDGAELAHRTIVGNINMRHLYTRSFMTHYPSPLIARLCVLTTFLGMFCPI